MKYKTIPIVLIFLSLSFLCIGQPALEYQKNLKVVLVNRDAEKKIDVIVDGKLFTSYIWPENVYKPVLYPILTSAGTEITRGFPLKPRAGERNDHIHQVGLWLNYGMVNGHDFWGNGYRGIRESEGGEIKHLSFEKLKGGNGEGVLITIESWIDPEGKELLAEKTEFHFIARGTLRIIDRITTLTARDTTVFFKDTKEGMFGLRVARQLELPSDESVILMGADLKPASKKVVSKEGVTGSYRSSEGITGEAVWGKRAKWMDLYGTVGNEKVSVLICDHPKNQSYPTYWHARGYGLFAANPFGWKDFTNGKEILGYKLETGKSVTFRYRVAVNSGSNLTDNEITRIFNEFSVKY